MERRRFLIGTGALASGSAGAIGTGAFSSVEADRAVSVAVTNDADAYLGLSPNDTLNADRYVDSDGGTIEVSIGASGSSGTGVNQDAVTEFDRLFAVTNQGTQAIAFYIRYDPADAQSGFMPGPDESDRLDPSDPELGLDFYRADTGVALNHPTGRESIDRSVLFDPGESIDVGIRVDTRDFDADTESPLFDGSVTVTALGLGTDEIGE